MAETRMVTVTVPMISKHSRRHRFLWMLFLYLQRPNTILMRVLCLVAGRQEGE